ncbi:MAG: hypothetical protein RJQ09_18755 [Cyclobacteriaceae bacterium]
MKIASLSQLKKELSNLPPVEVISICLRIVKHKKENKELLHYLLLEADNEDSYVDAIKEDISEGFENINKSNHYWAMKSIRKILRSLNKFIRFSGKKESEVELRLFFCKKILSSGLRLEYGALRNLYLRQISLIEKAISVLHEDLQFDFEADLREIRLDEG